MVRGWTVLLLMGTTLAWGAGPGEAALPPGGEDRWPATRLERPSEATATATDELLEISGLRKQMAALAAGIRSQLVTARPGLSPRDRALVERVVARHFDPDLLYARVRLAFARDVAPSSLDAALAWYRSPLGRRITRSEVEAITAERRTVPFPSAIRIQLVQRLDEQGGASETALEVAVSIVRSLAHAAAPLRSARLRLGTERLEARLARTRTEALAPIRISCLQNMLFAYRELDDPELAEYLRFVESPGGQWFVTRMNRALVEAVGATGELAAMELVTLVPGLTGERR